MFCNNLTPGNTALIEKLIVSQLLKRLPAYYVTGKLPFLPEMSDDPYPEPDESCPILPSYFLPHF
jgi:hypothetical protein